MNHLIIYVHPSTESFSYSILEKVKACSMKKECKTEVRDLYAIGFDPILKNEDFSGLCGGNTPMDIERERSFIEWAELITVIYPLWWAGMPAVLKGYIDRVFSHMIILQKDKSSEEQKGNNSNSQENMNICESANSQMKSKNNGGSQESGDKSALKGKKVVILTPMATPSQSYDNDGMTNSLKQTCDIGIFNYCGMEVVQHKFLGSISDIDKKAKEQYLQEVYELYQNILN